MQIQLLSTKTSLTKSTARIGLAVAFVAASVVGAAGTSEAATGVWSSMPSVTRVSGKAIIDSWRNGTFSNSAKGRVQFTLSNTCGYVRYAPYAVAAADGRWNQLPRYCGTGTVNLSWSDTSHLNYQGMKFQVCNDSGCGSVLYIRNW